jgi:hypothetical protein
MPHTHKPTVASLLFGLFATWSAVAQTAPLFQSVQITGESLRGFKKNCLIVYPDGEYHRERARQVSKVGTPELEWESPEVFEAKLAQADLDALQTILETPELSSINGVVGHSSNLLSRLVIGPHGAISPHDNIDIVTVAIARSASPPQVFELADLDVARRREPLKAFLNWINGLERSPHRVLEHPKLTAVHP